MDRNTITGLLLIFAILIGYSIWMAPDKEEIARKQQITDSLRVAQQIQDSIARISEQASIVADTSASVIENDPAISADSGTLNASLVNQFGSFAACASGEEKEIIIRSDFHKLGLTNKGAYIKSAELPKFRSWDSLALVLFAGDSNYFNYSFFSGNRLINTQDLYFTPFIGGIEYDGPREIRVEPTDSLTIAYRAYPETYSQDGAYIEIAYTIHGDNYMLDQDVRFHKMGQYFDSRVNYLTLDWGTRLRQQEKSLTNEQSTTSVYYKHLADEVSNLSERKDAEESIPTRLRWVAFKQQFFSTVLIADNSFINADLACLTEEGHGGRYLKTARASISIPLENAEEESIGMSMYIGPNKFSLLKTYKGLDLEDMIPLGWGILSWINKGAVIPVFEYLDSFNWNYGIIILILTILLKTVLFPIAYRTYVSSAKMRVLKPEIDEIGKKFPDTKDSMKKQQATMELYRKAGVNPMAGCVPMLLQLPILIALFRFFPASIELRQQSFLWATDLSAYDSIYDLPFNIPFYGDHVSLFTLLMTVSTIFYTKLNNQMMASSNQMPGMKTMMYLMPIMFLGFFNSYASGLSYYYFLANVITFGQMYIFRLLIDEDKLRARIEVNKKKPKKKSAFQKRLEDMQKAQQKGRK